MLAICNASSLSFAKTPAGVKLRCCNLVTTKLFVLGEEYERYSIQVSTGTIYLQKWDETSFASGATLLAFRRVLSDEQFRIVVMKALKRFRIQDPLLSAKQEPSDNLAVTAGILPQWPQRQQTRACRPRLLGPSGWQSGD